ncbi:MAG: hypothetical protein H0X51_08890 [Parachlamydiaceae bacterium]|nr:hypothetical protein [Parachlamydiaceae bacterium]
MKNLDEMMMRSLSFPDFNVEKMEFLPEKKILKVFVEGAWLEIDGGTALGKGVLFFNDWDVLSINRYDPILEKWNEIEISNSEELRDLCEVKFFNSNISLCGFGKWVGQWLEWKITNAKMHAQFETK